MVNKKKQYKKEDIITYNHSLKAKGISSYNVRSVGRSVLGVGCVVVGLLTSFIPFTSIPLYVVGGGLLGVDVVKLYYKIKGVLRYELNLWVLSATARLKAVIESLYLSFVRGYKLKW